MRGVFLIALSLVVSACASSSGIDREALRNVSDIPEGRGFLTGDSGAFTKTF